MPFFLQAEGETIPELLLRDLIKTLENSITSATSVQSTISNFLNGKYLSCQQVVQSMQVVILYRELIKDDVTGG